MGEEIAAVGVSVAILRFLRVSGAAAGREEGTGGGVAPPWEVGGGVWWGDVCDCRNLLSRGIFAIIAQIVRDGCESGTRRLQWGGKRGCAVRVLRVLTWGLFGGAVLIAAVGILTGKPPQVPAHPTPDQMAADEVARRPRLARVACQTAIKRTLNDPGSAEFLNRQDWPVREKPPDEFRVRVSLRAKNAFGALMLGEFVCVVRREAGDWRLIALDQTAP